MAATDSRRTPQPRADRARCQEPQQGLGGFTRAVTGSESRAEAVAASGWEAREGTVAAIPASGDRAQAGRAEAAAEEKQQVMPDLRPRNERTTPPPPPPAAPPEVSRAAGAVVSQTGTRRPREGQGSAVATRPPSDPAPWHAGSDMFRFGSLERREGRGGPSRQRPLWDTATLSGRGGWHQRHLLRTACLGRPALGRSSICRLFFLVNL